MTFHVRMEVTLEENAFACKTLGVPALQSFESQTWTDARNKVRLNSHNYKIPCFFLRKNDTLTHKTHPYGSGYYLFLKNWSSKEFWSYICQKADVLRVVDVKGPEKVRICALLTRKSPRFLVIWSSKLISNVAENEKRSVSKCWISHREQRRVDWREDKIEICSIIVPNGS